MPRKSNEKPLTTKIWKKPIDMTLTSISVTFWSISKSKVKKLNWNRFIRKTRICGRRKFHFRFWMRKSHQDCTDRFTFRFLVRRIAFLVNMCFWGIIIRKRKGVKRRNGKVELGICKQNCHICAIWSQKLLFISC